MAVGAAIVSASIVPILVPSIVMTPILICPIVITAVIVIAGLIAALYHHGASVPVAGNPVSPPVILSPIPVYPVIIGTGAGRLRVINRSWFIVALAISAAELNTY